MYRKESATLIVSPNGDLAPHQKKKRRRPISRQNAPYKNNIILRLDSCGLPTRKIIILRLVLCLATART